MLFRSIAEEQAKLFKQAKYNPFAGLIPLFIQIALLMGLVFCIYRPLTYALSLPAGAIHSLTDLTSQLTGVELQASGIQFAAIRAVQSAEFASPFEALGMDGVLALVRGLNLHFLGIDMGNVPRETGGSLLLLPLLAGFSAWLLCLVQNRNNVLQSEQSWMNKYGTMGLSVGLSLYLGAFVPAGIAIYWMASNLLSILQQLLLNRMIDPARYVDFEALEESKAELKLLSQIGTAPISKEDKKREKADYRRFFSIENKHLVFYSESTGFYKYFQKTIEHLLSHTNVTIHYVTSDPKDRIFQMAEENPQIKAYYIGEKRLITLMMKLEADICVMTLSDLDNYHIKRSYVKKDIEYVYMFHYPLSTHMVLHTGALDHYGTIFCVGDFQLAEIRKQEALYGLPAKQLVVTGYGQLELLKESYDSLQPAPRENPKVLIAPSWQPDNILDSCIHPLLDRLLGEGYDIYVRPHPEYMKRYKQRMDAIRARYQDYKGGNLFFELDFTSNTSLFDSDIVITDWSGAAYEFAFVTLRPVVFIDTPIKVNNPTYRDLDLEPLELSLRDKLGARLLPEELDQAPEKINFLLSHAEDYAKQIAQMRNTHIGSFGFSGEISGKYLVDSLMAKINSRKGVEKRPGNAA